MSERSGRSGSGIRSGGIRLPVRITALIPQKRNPDRISLFHEGEFLLGVSASTLLRFGLTRGSEITEELFEQISREEDLGQVRETALRLLSRRDHSRGELRKKMKQRGHPENAIHSVLEELQEKGYLDDALFARKFASDQLRFRGWGPLKIRNELQRKGIPPRIIDPIVDTLANHLELKKICVDLALKRRAHFSREADPNKRRQKIAAWLQGKGFTFETIHEALPDILDRLNVQEHNT